MKIDNHADLIGQLNACLEYLDKQGLALPAIKVADCLDLLAANNTAAVVEVKPDAVAAPEFRRRG